MVMTANWRARDLTERSMTVTHLIDTVTERPRLCAVMVMPVLLRAKRKIIEDE